MAEVLASLKKIGGNGEQYTETVLWTNPSPTANFSTQDVTLSQSIDNFKYIKFTYKGVSTVDTVSSEIISTADLNATTNVHNNYALGLCGFGNVSGSLKQWCRIIYHVNSTTIHFNPARTINEANTNDGRLIPLEILGINELAHGAGVLATPFQLTLKSTVANGRSVIEFDKSTFPYTKFRVISKTNNLRYIGNGSWVTLAVGDIVDFSALPDTSLTIDVSGSNTSTQSSIEFYN